MRVGSSLPRPLTAPVAGAPRRGAGPAAVDAVGEKDSRAAGGREQAQRHAGSSLVSANLTPDELRLIQKLRSRDQEVRAHEAAHRSAGGAFASAPSFQYETGPDGQRYAVGGEVSIDTSPVSGDPQATLAKAETIVHAALAPAHPSSQDRAVAQQAEATAAQARIELLLKRSSVEGGQGASSAGGREVAGEYLAAGSAEAAGSGTRDRQSSAIQALKAVQGMGAAELLKLGGRLDTHA